MKAARRYAEGTTVAVGKTKACAWGEAWRKNHAWRWNTSGDGLVPRHNPERRGEPSLSSCRNTILALERQINDGRQISAVPGKEMK